MKKFIGFGQEACKLVSSYLADRSQYVSSLNSSSKLSCIHSGVPQGSILGPILFSIFINDIVSCCRSSSIHLYADDAQIYLSRPLGLIEDLSYRINADLRRICNWSDLNHLMINTSKTKAICFHHTVLSTNLPEIRINNDTIVYAEVLKNLGFIMNTKLSCTHHVNATVQKIYCVLRKLWFAARFLQPDLKLKLIKSFIIPFITYGANVYGVLDSTSIKKLQLAINYCARFIYCKRKYDHISEESRTILGSTLQSYLNIRNLLLIHKIIYTKSPDYLHCFLKFSNSRRTHNIILPAHKQLTSSRMFFINAVRLWNSLPNSVKNQKNHLIFKTAIIKNF